MNTRSIILAAVLAAMGSVATAEVEREPGIPMPKPTPGPVMPDPSPITLKPSTAISAQSSSRSAADASNSVSIDGDSTRSVVAVFPAPSTAAVPTAHNCIVTKSTAGGIGWNLIQGATSEQYSDPMCVLQWLAYTSTDPTERAAMRAEIAKRLGVQ